MTVLAPVRAKIQTLFSKYLFVTNVATCGTLLGIGDFLVQRIDMLNDKQKKYDFGRTGRMIILGFGLGPFNHYWYAFLDRAVKGSGKIVVLKKIASDQAVAGPFFCTSFLIGAELLEGHGMQCALEEWHRKFWSIYLVDWMFWPLAQWINFSLLPTRYRVVYVSCATMIWNSFLSYMKHQKSKPC